MRKLSEINIKLKGKFSVTNKIIQFKQKISTCLHWRFSFQFRITLLKYKFGAKYSHHGLHLTTSGTSLGQINQNSVSDHP